MGLYLVVPLLALTQAPAEPPKELAVPAGHKRLAAVYAAGFQVYQAIPGKSGGLEWSLEGPLAELVDDRGRPVGRHYDGPSWEAADGSKVARDPAHGVKQLPAPDPKTAIPWLLVRVKAADDAAGAFAGALYIQRLDTAGGLAPPDPPKRAGTKVGVPYTATYRMWAKEG